MEARDSVIDPPAGMPGELPEARASRVLINRVAETGFGLYPPHAVGRNRGPDRVEAMRMKTPPFPADAADPAAVDAAPRDRSRLKPGCVLMLPTENGHRQCCQPLVRNGFFCQEHS